MASGDRGAVAVGVYGLAMHRPAPDLAATLLSLRPSPRLCRAARTSSLRTNGGRACGSTREICPPSNNNVVHFYCR